MKGFEIRAALDGGYVVTECLQGAVWSGMLFAGTLNECLGYIERKFSPSKPDNEPGE